MMHQRLPQQLTPKFGLDQPCVKYHGFWRTCERPDHCDPALLEIFSCLCLTDSLSVSVLVVYINGVALE